jgi:acyl dehydratase
MKKFGHDDRLYLDDLRVGQRFTSGTHGWRELNWPNPTRPGDTLQVESEVLDIRPSRSRQDRGVATVRSLTRNQRNEVVQVLTAKLIVPRRV